MSTTVQTIDRIDKAALKQKYLQERDKRLRPGGNAQYVRIEDVRILEKGGDFAGIEFN